jgi:hypothetical protein
MSLPSKVSPKVQFHESAVLKRRTYSVQKCHIGNSTIQFEHKKVISYGCITRIFTSVQFPGHFFMIVSPFKELDKNDTSKNPYQKYPHLNCQLVYSHSVPSIAIDNAAVGSHAAPMKNPPGTFNVACETCCVVGLASMVSCRSVLGFPVELKHAITLIFLGNF